MLLLLQALLKSFYQDANTNMPQRIHYILFEKDFNDCLSGRVDTTITMTTNITDVERRTTFINEMNTILSKRSKEKEHLLSSLILQLIRLRFPNELDKYKPPHSGFDLFIQQFIQWTVHVK